jgi:transglutaminase-like putative cysteine protease
MSLIVALTHKTHYEYAKPVMLSEHFVRLKPLVYGKNIIHSHILEVSPKNHKLYWKQDPLGNHLASLYFNKKLKNLTIKNNLVVELVPNNPFDFIVEQYAEKHPFSYNTGIHQKLEPYFKINTDHLIIDQWIKEKNLDISNTLELLVNLNQTVFAAFEYTARFDPGVFSFTEMLEKQSGACRDFAFFLIQLLRKLGFASRFVSGYFVEIKEDGNDTLELHAWVEVYLPGAGWVGLDPTSGCLTSEKYIALFHSANLEDCMPISGSLEPTESKMHYQFSLKRILSEEKRVVQKSILQDLNCLGEMVDRKDKENNIYCTMGSEPTFISIDNHDLPEWNTEALGDNKKALAAELMEKVSVEYGAGALLDSRIGKWYAGEMLPRWSFNCYWRADGEPIVETKNIIINTQQEIQSKKTYCEEDAETLLKVLSKTLGVSEKFILKAYEDIEYLDWFKKEKQFENDLTGFVLP